MDEEGDEMTREFLESLRRLVLYIKAEETELKKLENELTSPQGLNTDVKVQSSGYEWESKMAEFCDRKERLEAKKAEADCMKQEAEKIYEQFGEDSIMLRCRFSRGYTWENVIKEMPYDERTVWRHWRKVRRKLR